MEAKNTKNAHSATSSPGKTGGMVLEGTVSSPSPHCQAPKKSKKNTMSLEIPTFEELQLTNGSPTEGREVRDHDLGHYAGIKKIVDSQVLQQTGKMRLATPTRGHKGLLHSGERGKAPRQQNT